LEYLKKGNELPDIIVMDLNMPKMDGQTCLTTIKKEAHLLHIPVAILSTGNNPKSIKDAYDGGAFKYFVKPYSLTDFKKIIQEILSV
jgi:CheY-like chemotaxis protein